MKPAPFAYAKARSLDHAIELLSEDAARVLAGGQSLIPVLNMRLDAPKLLVDINGLEGLDRIELVGDELRVGALVRHAEALRSPLIAQHAPLIAAALPYVGHAAIRNRGTIGGSIALADPAAELPACLLALGGSVEISGRGGSRTVPADAFFRGLFETAVGPGEVLTAVRVPVAKGGATFGFQELSRRHGDYALVGLAAATTGTNGSGRPRLVFFGVGPTPVRATGAEQALSARNFPDAIDDAVAAIATDLDPGDDIHGSGAVRKHLAGVLLRRVLQNWTEARA